PYQEPVRTIEERVLRRRLAAGVARSVRVGEVDQDALDARAVDRQHRAGRAGRDHGLEDVRRDLEVPGVVDGPGLEERPGRGLGVAATLEVDRLEVRLVRVAEVRVRGVGDDVTRLE